VDENRFIALKRIKKFSTHVQIPTFAARFPPMLSRRQIRVKVLQALYAYFQAEKTDLAVAERELFRSIEKTHELYLFLLLFLTELAHADSLDVEEAHRKFFPLEEELKTGRRLNKISFLKELAEDGQFKQMVKKYSLSWQTEQDLIRKIFLDLKKSKTYKSFLLDESAVEKDFMVKVLKEFMEKSEAFVSAISERNIYWNDDFEFCIQMAVKTVKNYYDQKKLELFALYKDEEDDRNFAKQLFEKTVLHNMEYEKSISEKTKNWEVDRIAMLDILLMKMALAELTTFKNIPVKVSINEYLDIAKDFSTPKSNTFINGIIDKLAADYKAAGKIEKTGRGLLE
jgi:transcription antitermination protein NusB